MSLDTGNWETTRKSASASDRIRLYSLYQRLFSENSQFVGNVEKKLAEARMAENVEMYLSRALGVGILSGVFLWLFTTMIAAVIVDRFLTSLPVLVGVSSNPTVVAQLEQVKLLGVILVSGLVFGTIGFSIGFGIFVLIPYYRAGERKRQINMLLPDAIAYMYALSIGGLNQLDILRAMAKADDTYGAAAEEFQAIILETEYFDVDYRTAIRNQAMVTPSSELNQFLTDMLSIVHSGGNMTEYLENQRDKHFRTAKREQEQILDSLELFGEMYMTLSLFPLLLIIIIVVMNMVGGTDPFLLPGSIYLLIPIIGVAFIVLVSTVTQDELGGGYLYPDEGKASERVDTTALFQLGTIEEYEHLGGIFSKIKKKEAAHEMSEILKRPDLFFREHPMMTLVVTTPLAILSVVLVAVLGIAPLSIEALVESPVSGTFVWIYLPLYITLIPLTVFYEWNMRSRNAIVTNLSDELRKLASANGTGLTLLQSIKVVADTSRGKLAHEFGIIHSKANYGMSLKEAFRGFNNRYRIPRLARMVKLITKAQETSGEITNVLSTAAQASENQDDIERERVSRTLMQTVIIIMTYLTLLGVMAILKTQFLDVMAGLQADQQATTSASSAGEALGANIDTDLLSLYFFHAVTLQAVLSGLISGYMQSKLLNGVKFVVILQTVALLVWLGVG